MNADDFLHLRDPRSRRNFFRLAGLTTVGGSAMFLAACGGSDKKKGGASTTSGGSSGAGADVSILNSALDLENTAIAAYTAGAPLLKGAALSAGKLFLSQEKEHAQGLTQAIKDMGGKPNRAKSMNAYVQGFPKLKTQTDVLRFAVDVENMAVAAYIGAIPKLKTPTLRQTAAAIETNEAEHISVLLGALNANNPVKQVPDAFVTGKA